MRSTSGEHYIALDHVRAVATFMVFVWHFIHSHYGSPVPFEYVPSLFFLSVLDEGHTGVALFMTLSGYLFAKLLDGKKINWPAFYWNRFLRLFPLLFIVVLVFGYRKVTDTSDPTQYLLNLHIYLNNILNSFWLPTLPNGGWSVTVEMHFYLLLPLLLLVQGRFKYFLTGLVVAALCFRFYFYMSHGEVFSLSYWTIVGRVDQFVCGIIAFKYRHLFINRHLFAALLFLLFTLFYWTFDTGGGYHNGFNSDNNRFAWVYLPTIEAIVYSLLIAWYDNSFNHKNAGFSGFLSKIGEYSYSIYLLHVFIVFWLARMINEKIMDISNFYVAVLWAAACFLLMYPVGYLSFRFIESPFLKHRKRYVKY